ncbi:hypothetical protein GE21DRAFT_6416 [Neurospora crassa]|uniref:Uncharacterized protein n=1 Tax=Neurospora crassa (strain ATCC 24698 / 74-OR23-1A / CBS 708.71 / DSM 1257 / FGSC 987) TaxID=367110 RepID=Q7S942_NEUCR|nr:hypothetical protein NCU07274 [Neurospora crassa OR74A]EAA32892.2 hypothetical protein NCU07274 [Neurospora crassa OR74A]KHE88696.1 hypothetical protein GE21DRAFT_6416 [Neurospora crassa]|eukprot:XP_962128.2 hypothetical protein NCU07274 [Neurospora crassa OR74A]
MFISQWSHGDQGVVVLNSPSQHCCSSHCSDDSDSKSALALLFSCDCVCGHVKTQGSVTANSLLHVPHCTRRRSTQDTKEPTTHKKHSKMGPSSSPNDLVQLLSKLSVENDSSHRSRGCPRPGVLQLSNGTEIHNLPVPIEKLSSRHWEKKDHSALPMIYFQPPLPMPPRPQGLSYPGWNTDVVGLPTIPSLLAMPRVFPAHQGFAECSSPVIEHVKFSSYAALGFCVRDARVDPAATVPPCTLDPQLAHAGVVRTCADRCHLEPHKLCEHCSDQSRLLVLNGLPKWFTNDQIIKSRSFLCAPCSTQEARKAVRWAEAEATLEQDPDYLAHIRKSSEPGIITDNMMRYHNDTTFPVATPPMSDSLAQALADNAPSMFRTAKKLFRCSCHKLITADLCLGHRLLRADQFLEQARRLDEWTRFRFGLGEQDFKPCPKCMVRPGVDAHSFNNSEGGADLTTVHWICMCCQETASMSRYEFFQQGGGLGQEKDDKRLADLLGVLGF